MLSLIFANAMGPWSGTGIGTNAWYPLLVLGPSVAGALAGFGVTKDDIRRYVYEHAMIPAGAMERCVWQVAGRRGPSLAERAAKGEIPAVYGKSDDPERLVPMVLRPDWISIVLAGNPGRNQSRAYVNNHLQGPPVSRQVTLPRSWPDQRE
jgi:hypothetical protein